MNFLNECCTKVPHNNNNVNLENQFDAARAFITNNIH